MHPSPLFPPGVHDVSEADLESHFSTPFASSKTRGTLVSGLRQFLEALRRFGISFEVWIDGSFSTDKENPADVDLVFFGSAADIDALPEHEKHRLKSLVKDRVSTREKFGCDAYFSVLEEPQWRSYWRGWYGFDRLENPKGIIRLTVRP